MHRILLSGLLCLFLTPVIKADDVVITLGNLVYPGFIEGTSPFQYNFSGQDLVVSGSNITNEAAGPFCISGGVNQPCIGASLNFLGGLRSGGQVTYQGVTYILGGSSRPFLNLRFSADSVLLPQELWFANAVRITAPFTFGGNLVNDSGLRIGFIGQGFVQALLVQDRGPHFGLSNIRDVNYTFLPPGTPPPPIEIQPIPEPASVLLLATGVVGGAVARKIRKSTQ